MSSFHGSKLGQHFQELSDEDRIQYGRSYLQDFVLLSLKIKSKDELKVDQEETHGTSLGTVGVTHPCRVQVFFRALVGCVSELQASPGLTGDFSPAWILAAARRFAPRLDALQHVLLLQPQLVTDITQQGAQKEPEDMVGEASSSSQTAPSGYVLPRSLWVCVSWQMEDILALAVCVEQTRLLPLTSLQECEAFVKRVELLQPCLERAFGQRYGSLCSPRCLQELASIRWV